jgi:signal transduction histidine kinase
VAVCAVLTAAGWALERMYARTLLRDATLEVAARLAGHGSALELAMARRAALLDGLTAWIVEEGSQAQGGFRAFAEALRPPTGGVRALQLVEGARIADSYPAARNEGVVGFDLLVHPDPQVPEGLLRALDTGGTTVTGPVDLIQGGAGVILRRSAGPPGDREATSAALVIDVSSLMEEAGLTDSLSGLRVGLETETGIPFFGEAPSAGERPVHLAIPLPEGSWTLVAAPSDGWASVTRRELRSVRTGVVLVVTLTTVLVLLLVDRDTRLAGAVAARTAQLSESNRRLEGAAAELSAREEQLSAALEAGSVVTWSWEVRTGQIVRAETGGALRIGGAAPPTTVRGLLETIHPDDRPGMARALDAARVSGVVGHEYRLGTGAGSYIWVRAEGRAVESDAEGPVRIVGASADISRVKHLEAQLVHRGRLELIGRLAGGIAHDFNNLLTVIRAELELGLEEGTRERLGEAASEALNAAQHASVLTGQLLIFARRDVSQPTTFDWDAACGETISFVRRLLGGLVELEVHLGAPGALVHMDRSQAIQILTNLAVNAKDAMPRGGKVTIRTHAVADGRTEMPEAPGGPAVVLSVHDTGHGIPPDARPHVFEPFYTTKAEGSGTGLGLSTAQGIARKNGGEISFRTSDRGTTFVVVLPRARTA